MTRFPSTPFPTLPPAGEGLKPLTLLAEWFFVPSPIGGGLGRGKTITNCGSINNRGYL